MMSRALFIPCAVGLALLPLSGYASDWSHYRGPSGGGVSAERINPSQKGCSVLWREKVGVGTSSVVVDSGRLYTMGNVDSADWVRCFDAASGKLVWSFHQPVTLDPNLFEGGSRSTPTVAGDAVYAVSHDGQVVCLDAVSGAVRWRKDLVKNFGGRKPDWGYSGAPLVADGRVYFDTGGVGSSTIALDAKSGELVWKSGSEPAGYASPLILDVDARRTLVLLKGDVLLGLDPQTGASLWRHPWKTSYDVNAATPVQVASNRLLLSSGYNTGAAVVAVEGGVVGVQAARLLAP